MATNDVFSESGTQVAGTDTPAAKEECASAIAEAKAKKKREKLRSAWISFVGRILAQLVGAVATIALGLVVVQHYGMGRVMPDTGSARTSTNNAPAEVEPPKRANDGRPTVVVLPFANFSADAGLEPFVDGLTEVLVAELTHTRTLRVISRTSSMHYKDSRRPLKDIARELDVDLVVEGSVAQYRGRIRVVAQLIDASTDDHLWAQSYERGFGDVLRLQDSMARVIAQEVMRAAAAALLSRTEPSAEHAHVTLNQRGMRQ